MPTQEAVSRALDNAIDSGYDFEGWSFTELSEDLISNDKDFEDCEAEEIKTLVDKWYTGSGFLFLMYAE